MFERAGVAGGVVKTAELALTGLRHDLYAMRPSLFAGSPFLAAHRGGSVRHGLAFVLAPDGLATAFPDATWLGVSQDVGERGTCRAPSRGRRLPARPR